VTAAQAGSLGAATPVSAADFALLAPGRAPVPGDQLIPNPATPDGKPLAVASRCGEVIAAGRGVTAATVNRRIAYLENRLRRPFTLCLAGTFTDPIEVWGKYDPALLTIEPAPGRRAALELGAVQPSAVNPDEFDGVAGGVSIVGSTGVEVRGLAISGYHTLGTAQTPAGIYVEVRARGFGGAPSACFLRAQHACGGIYLLDNHIYDIANVADERAAVKRWCDNGNVDAFGIEVESYGRGVAQALQHVVVEGNVIDHTRTGQSETLAINGDVTDFVVARNRIYDTDNIGIDTEGWYSGTSQASHGLISDNVVANVDTYDNRAYGVWNNVSGVCAPLSPNAAGIYDDGAAYIWVRRNLVMNTDQGISLDTETAGRFSDHILVTQNTVTDTAGTRLGDPSFGPNPPGVPGRSTVAGHAYDAFYIDAFGAGSSIFDVVAAENRFVNASSYFGGRRRRHDYVVVLGGQWSHVVLFHNTIVAGGAANRWVFALGLDHLPTSDAGTVIDCTTYRSLSRVHDNFSLPNRTFSTLSAWQRGNGYGWDAHSSLGTLKPAAWCKRLASRRRGQPLAAAAPLPRPFELLLAELARLRHPRQPKVCRLREDCGVKHGRHGRHGRRAAAVARQLR
jgi:hypothetical protein